MRTAIAVFILTILVSGVGTCADRESIGEFYTSLEEGLLDLGMTPEDFRIREDYADPDVFRLPLIDSLMHDPAEIVQHSGSTSGTEESCQSINTIWTELW